MSRATEPRPVARCAIYTRKSSEEGLEKEFNSLDAQRESGEAYIASQRGAGWVCLPERYDDGGFTGGNIERPAMKRLMADIEAGKVDCVVVYKVDRLSRSLLDFTRLMEVFDRKRVSFVSVTQQFNTAQSMGRLTLNILLSFAQFEREIISERTRDKIAAARRKGKWIGGRPILGYDIDPKTKRLVVNEGEAARVRELFRVYLERKTLLGVARELNRKGWRTKAVTPARGKPYGGRPWDKSSVFQILTNVAYIGRVRYKTETHPGEHKGIVDEALWGQVQGLLRNNGRSGGMFARNKHGALLKGLLRCAACGKGMGHTYAVRAGKRIYRYYVCLQAQKQGWDACPCKSLPAEQIESFVVNHIKRIGLDSDAKSLVLEKVRSRWVEVAADAEAQLRTADREMREVQEALSQAAAEAATNPHAAARLADLHTRTRELNALAVDLRERLREAETETVGKSEVDAALAEFHGLWGTLSPSEQARLLRTLVQRVEYDARAGSVAITFHPTGLRALSGAAHHEGEAA